ncbi:MAG TPA: hypothetical protein VJZ76_17455 [Thermoanaerobaculia bacterium]|nr:hypothetical protein [Thermoanaerobaculia bacterium]
MANPLSMYVPIKQDKDSQKAATDAAKDFVKNVEDGLNASGIVHYAKLVLIPNADGDGTQALFLSTVFDESMREYLRFFWEQPGINIAIQGIAAVAATAPDPPITDLDSFQSFIESVDLEADLYQAYPDTVKQIKAKKS